jgi:biopolymer transport protein ExbB
MGWELFEQGGIVMYPLAVCSILALAISLERAFALRRNRIIRPEIVSVIDNIQGPEDIGLALSVCRQYEGPFSNVMRAGLDNRDLPLDEIRESIIDQGRQEMGHLQKGLVVLETVAGVSPLLGLLGTVLGMIKVFQQISEVGVGQGNLMAGGIAEAILTTAAGLFIAIPALVCFNLFSNRAENLILEIEKYANALLKKLRGFQVDKARLEANS